MITNTYSIGGLRIEVECCNRLQSQRLDSLWQSLFAFSVGPLVETGASVYFNFSAQQQVSPPAIGDKVFESPSLQVLKTACGFHLTCGSSTLGLNVSEGSASGTLSEEFWSLPLYDQREFFLLGFLMLLRQRGLYGLHSNAVTYDDSGALIVGNSGAGKTTLTIALIKVGWSYLSDDALLLRKCSERVEALALRRGFSLTSKTTRFFPELEASELVYRQVNDGKKVTDLSAIYPGRFTPRCYPEIIVFPKIATRNQSALTPLSQPEALARLIEQSPGIVTDRALVNRQMAVLGLLVQQSQSYELLVGSDVHERPSDVSKILSKALRG